MEKLALSKAIMDKADGIKSSNSMNGGLPPTSLQQFDVPNAKYNIPSEFLQEGPSQQTQYLSSVPRENTKPVGNPTVDAIKNSKLPDEIKKLMMEHPIQQPTMGVGSGTLSNELVEKASRLMNINAKGELLENKQPQRQQQPQQSNVGVDANVIRDIVRETVQDVLRENGLLTESETKSNEVFKFRVGQHIFEGKLIRVKKIAK